MTKVFQRNPAQYRRHALGAIGVAAIVFDSQTAFPGVAALVPTLGAAAVIFFGQGPTPFGPARLLGLRPMVFVGAISYSLYLVHWPLLVIPAAAGGSGEPLPGWMAIALGIVGVPIAWLLYELVENPVRRSRALAAVKARWTLVMAAGASVTTVAIAVALIASVGAAPLDAGKQAAEPGDVVSGPQFTSYVPSNLEPSLESAADNVPRPYADGCRLGPADTDVRDCVYGDEESDTVVALFGDSHAAQWFPAMEKLAIGNGFRLELYFKSSCPSVDVEIYTNAVPYVECATWRQAVVDHLTTTKPDLVVMSNMANQPDQPRGGIRADDWAVGVASVLDKLAGTPALIISDTPKLPGTPSICLSANLNDANACAERRSDALDEDWEDAESRAASAAGARVIDLNDFICNTDECGMIIGSTLVYRDSHHLTATFAEELAPELWKAIEPLLDPAA